MRLFNFFNQLRCMVPTTFVVGTIHRIFCGLADPIIKFNSFTIVNSAASSQLKPKLVAPDQKNR